MTDITGNFSVNKPPYPKENQKKENLCPECGRMCDDVEARGIDLDKDPAAIAGKAMINTTKVGRKNPYVFDPKKVEEDVLILKAIIDTAEDYMEDLMAKGIDPKEAAIKADVFASCLIGAYEE